jgi:CMP-N,N'-diacetyllegionaminic acid synthase
MHEILGLIPARGGSKSIPQKNVAPLAGRPLLAYTCEAALASARLTRVVVSTDDKAIAGVARDCGVEAPFMRPTHLAQDDTPSLAVVAHCLKVLEESDEFKPDIVVLLQPTSPLRTAEHIDEALAQMEEADAETVVSVMEVPHRFSPYGIMSFDGNWLQDFWQVPLSFDRYRRQDMPALFARNGPAVLATRTSVLRERGSFYGARVIPYLMGIAESIDIDNPFDLELAAWLLARKAGS